MLGADSKVFTGFCCDGNIRPFFALRGGSVRRSVGFPFADLDPFPDRLDIFDALRSRPSLASRVESNCGSNTCPPKNIPDGISDQDVYLRFTYFRLMSDDHQPFESIELDADLLKFPRCWCNYEDCKFSQIYSS